MMDRLADQGVAAKRTRELAQVHVDAEREPHPLDRELEHRPPGGVAPRRSQHDPCSLGLPGVDDDALAADVEQP
jgi:hypothetical protein